jgi:hypothetical protein
MQHHSTFAEIVADEAAQVAAGAKGCGKTCDDGCHGDLVCARVQHPHDPDADMPPHPSGLATPKGNVTPHAGYTADGHVVQWTCLPGDHDGLTPKQRAAARAQTKADATRALLDTLDVPLLVQLLRDSGHL